MVMAEAYAAINNIALDAVPGDLPDPRQPELLRRETSRTRLAASGAVEQACKALKLHKEQRHFDVLESICRALATVVYGDPAAKVRAAELGAPAALLDIIEMATDDGVQKRRGQGKKKAVKLERPGLIAQALRALATLVANVLEKVEDGVRVVRRPVQVFCCEHGALKVVSDVMRSFKDSEDVQWEAFACMANLLAQSLDKYKVEAELLGVLRCCMDALLKFKASKVVQAEAMRCLMNACNSNVQNEDRAVAGGAIDRAVAAMQAHPTAPEVNEMACRLLLALVWSRMANRAMAIRAGADKQLQIVKDTFGGGDGGSGAGGGGAPRAPAGTNAAIAEWASAALNKIASSA